MWDQYAPATAADADCHFGDHYWQRNGYCSNCGQFNGGLLQYHRQEKAEREGRLIIHNGDHTHYSARAYERCVKRQP